MSTESKVAVAVASAERWLDYLSAFCQILTGHVRRMRQEVAQIREAVAANEHQRAGGSAQPDVPEGS